MSRHVVVPVEPCNARVYPCAEYDHITDDYRCRGCLYPKHPGKRAVLTDDVPVKPGLRLLNGDRTWREVQR